MFFTLFGVIFICFSVNEEVVYVHLHELKYMFNFEHSDAILGKFLAL